MLILSLLLLFTIPFNLYRKNFLLACFNSIWCLLFMSLSLNTKISYFDISNVTIICIVLMVAGFNLGYSSSIIFIRKNRLNNNEMLIEKVFIFRKKRFELLLWMNFLLCFYFSFKAFRYYGFDLRALRSMAGGVYEEGVFQTSIESLIFNGIIAPFVNVSFVILLYNVILNEFNRKHIILAIVNLLLYTYVSSGRTMLFRVIIYMVSLLIVQIKIKNIIRNRINFKQLFFIIISVYLILTLITTLRNTVDITFIEQTMEYLQGSFCIWIII